MLSHLERFHICYEKYGPMVFRIALNQLGNQQEAEDVVQDVFIKWMHQREFESQEHEKRWLIRVTINHCKNVMKKAKISSWESVDAFYPIATERSPEEMDLAVSILALDPETRNIIYLFYYEGYSVKEIAAMLSMTASKVKMRLSRGRQQLKISLEEQI